MATIQVLAGLRGQPGHGLYRTEGQPTSTSVPTRGGRYHGSSPRVRRSRSELGRTGSRTMKWSPAWVGNPGALDAELPGALYVYKRPMFAKALLAWIAAVATVHTIDSCDALNDFITPTLYNFMGARQGHSSGVSGASPGCLDVPRGGDQRAGGHHQMPAVSAGAHWVDVRADPSPAERVGGRAGYQASSNQSSPCGGSAQARTSACTAARAPRAPRAPGRTPPPRRSRCDGHRTGMAAPRPR